MNLRIAVCAFALVSFTNSNLSFAQNMITSTFDEGLEGWTVIGDVNSFEHSIADGNPAPMVQIVDAAAGEVYRAVAPPEFLGDLRRFDGGTISFDARIVSGSGAPFAQFGGTRIHGVDDVATRDIADKSASSEWQTFCSDLSASNWGKTQAEWDSILANVIAIDILVEAVSGAETMGFDNPTLYSTFLLGDVNLDGAVDLLDVAPFINLLSSGGFQAEADINQDGVVDLLDVAPFVDLLSGG